MAAVQETVEQVRRINVNQYKYGFETAVESEKAPKGLDEGTVRFISAKKQEPAWMLEWRLAAYRHWLTMREPNWAKVHYPKIDYQDLYYYAAPKKQAGPKSLDEVDPEILKTYEKLGIPLHEREILAGVERPEGSPRVAVDAVFDSVSVATTFKEELKKAGVIFMPDFRSFTRISGPGAQVSRHGGAGFGQFLRNAQFCGVFRRVVRLHSRGRPLSDGAIDLFPHQ